MPDESKQTRQEENLNVFLQNTCQGFWAFDKMCNILPDFMETIERCLGESLDGKNALEMLFQWGEPSNKNSAGFQRDQDLGMLQDLLETVFLRVTDLDVMIELLPAEISKNDRYFSLKYQYIQSPASIDEDRILVVMTDITREKELQTQIKTESDRNDMIRKIAMDTVGFAQYRKHVEELLVSLREELEKEIDTIDLGIILHGVNGILGGAEIYEINDLVILAQRMMSHLTEILEKKNPEITREKIEHLAEDLGNLQECFDFLQSRYLETLLSDEQILNNTIYQVTESKLEQIKEVISNGVVKDGLGRVERLIEKNYAPFMKHPQLAEITEQRMESMKSTLWNNIAQTCNDELFKVVESLKKQAVSLILNKYALIVENLGQRYNKQVEVEIVGADVEVSYHRFEDLFSSMVHILRNAVEHGLESMEERVFFGKSLEGKIKLEASIEEDRFILSVSDDGRGLDVEKVKEAVSARELLPPSELEEASKEEILHLMLHMGFSTKSIVNETSGRGVGLDVLSTVVDELQGDVSIQTEEGEGTMLTVSVPLIEESN